MRQIRDEGLPEHFSASTHARQRHNEVGRFMEDVDFENADLSTVAIPIQKPATILKHAAATCRPFAALLRSALPATGDAVMTIVCYFDEIEVADRLKKGDREVLAIYWSLKEFGIEALSQEECWFTLGLIRTHPILAELLDGHCQVMCRTLDAFFCGRESFSTGVVIDVVLEDGVYTCFTRAIFGILVSDEKAIKQISGAKGASGRKPNLFTMNVKNWRFFKADPTGFHVPSTCLDKRAMRLHTDASVKEAYRKVLRAKATMTKGKLAEYEREMGFGAQEKYHPLLRDEFLPISVIMYDIQHVYLCDGIFDGEVQAFMDRLEESDCGLGWEAPVI